MLSITSKIDTFIKEPFNPNMDLWQWGAFILVVILIAWLWIKVLESIKSAI